MNAKKLMDELLDLAIKNEKTGLVLLDAIISDALDEDRMATAAELAEIQDILKARTRPKLVLILNEDI